MRYTELSEVAKRHKDWIALVKSFGEQELAEDIVQDMYLKIDQKEEVNDGYIYLTLRSITLNHFYDKQKRKKTNLEDCNELEQIDNTEREEAFGKVLDKINKEMCSWIDYDQNLFRIYFHTDLSLRQMADKLDLEVSHIYNTIRRCKDKLQENVCEDWQDYLNKDYELI